MVHHFVPKAFFAIAIYISNGNMFSWIIMTGRHPLFLYFFAKVYT